MSNPSTPPPLPDRIAGTPGTGLALFLSLVLGFFLISAVVSFLDDSLLVTLERQHLTVLRVLISLLMLPVGALTFLMVAIFPEIPKRAFLAVALFTPVSIVAALPLFVYFHESAAWISWGISFIQILVGGFLLHQLQGAWKLSWRLVPQSRLTAARFTWTHFTGMMLTGLFLILPMLALYTAGSAKLAVKHFSSGFVDLTPAGITMEVRDYIRPDGKKIILAPMSHVGDPKFYQEVSNSFPTDAVVLMEGVSDSKKVLQVASNYSKMAEALGGVEQHEAFKPRGEIVAADMDLSDFSPATLDLLRTAMLVHSKGITPETLPILMKPTPPGLERQLMDDILTKRNEHLLKVLHERLPDTDHIIVPWGAAHMPGISREILKSGFKNVGSRDYLAIRFGS